MSKSLSICVLPGQAADLNRSFFFIISRYSHPDVKQLEDVFESVYDMNIESSYRGVLKEMCLATRLGNTACLKPTVVSHNLALH